MLTRQYQHIHDATENKKMSVFEARYYTHQVERAGLPCSWQGDTELFSREDADYWISQFTRLGAMGERVGWVKVVEENTGAQVPVTK